MTTIRQWLRLGFPLTVAVVLAAACSSAVETLDPVTLQAGPRTASQVPATGKPTPLDFSDEASDREADGDEDEGTGLPAKRRVVSGDIEDIDEDLPLAQIARRERTRRASAAPPVASIDDKNIERRAAEGPEPVVAPEPPTTAPALQSATPRSDDDTAVPEGSPRTESEHYWRDRVRSLRYQWLDLVAREETLVSKVNGLRRDYYEEDDGYYRDAEIKPAWDQAWEDLQRTRQEIVATVDELDRTIEDGRRAGALPGWLREGAELEPERPSAEERRRLDTAEPVEPTEINEAAEIDS